MYAECYILFQHFLSKTKRTSTTKDKTTTKTTVRSGEEKTNHLDKNIRNFIYHQILCSKNAIDLKRIGNVIFISRKFVLNNNNNNNIEKKKERKRM